MQDLDDAPFAMFERPELERLPPATLAALESAMDPAWPDTWREFAVSLYLTLLASPDRKDTDRAQSGATVRLALALTLGIAQDLGGTQPYIPVGAMLAASARARRAIEMRQRGATYKDAADATGLTEARIRKIEGEWRREQIARRQGRLHFDG